MSTETKNNAPAAEDTAKAPAAKAAANKTVESSGPVKEFYDEKGAESLSNIQKGGSAVKVNLTNKTLVEFTEDYKNFKKGHKQEVSDVALAIYQKAKVIKKL